MSAPTLADQAAAAKRCYDAASALNRRIENALEAGVDINVGLRDLQNAFGVYRQVSVTAAIRVPRPKETP